jgi:DNA-binding response OmpR family regulator
MRLVIVESNEELGRTWKRHLERFCNDVIHVTTEDSAIRALDEGPVSLLLLDLVLVGGCALAVADYARFRHPDAKIVFVTNTTFFSDGSIFQHIPNACAFLPSKTDPEDLAAVVQHHWR